MWTACAAEAWHRQLQFPSRILDYIGKYGLKEPLDKTLMANILKLFSRYNLIEVKGKVGEPDCLIRLYASLQFALDTEEFKKFVEVTEKRMMEKEDTEMEEDADDAE